MERMNAVGLSRIGIVSRFAAFSALIIPVFVFSVKGAFVKATTKEEQLCTLLVLSVLLVLDLLREKPYLPLGDVLGGVTALPLAALTVWRMYLLTQGRAPGYRADCLTAVFAAFGLAAALLYCVKRFLATVPKARPSGKELSEDRAFAVAANEMLPAARRIQAVDQIRSLTGLEALDAECRDPAVKRAIRSQMRFRKKILRLAEMTERENVRPFLSGGKLFRGNTCRTLETDRTGEAEGSSQQTEDDPAT